MIHADLLKLLLPPSSLDPGAPALSAELLAEGNALDAAAATAELLLDEADPRTTSAFLTDWERVAGLPDGCVLASGIAQSSAQRRAALVARITMLGGQSAAYYIALAASLGYTITVTEFDLHDVDDSVEHPLTGAPWQFAWRVNAPLNTIGVLAVTDTVADPLAWWGNELLECVINRLKPAHTHVLFAYT